MILVVTDASDPSLGLFEADPDVLVVTPRSLSVAGWSLEAGQPPTLPGSLGGDPAQPLLVRISRVHPGALPHIHPADRTYVAHEMTAFLAAAIDAWPGNRLNSSTAASLNGLGRSREGWLRALHAGGIRVCAACPPAPQPQTAVVGSEVFDNGTPRLRVQRAEIALRTAAATQSAHLAVIFCTEHRTNVSQVTYQPQLVPRTWTALKAFLTQCGPADEAA